ncbi:hypothetical protein F4775DRAFT_264647 [Biscogniauxia sp. FL1348]|nr:hypothetical protein F4775DRAFT_264647 [Biscogniauxia sp. FL1348]
MRKGVAVLMLNRKDSRNRDRMHFPPLHMAFWLKIVSFKSPLLLILTTPFHFVPCLAERSRIYTEFTGGNLPISIIYCMSSRADKKDGERGGISWPMVVGPPGNETRSTRAKRPRLFSFPSLFFLGNTESLATCPPSQARAQGASKGGGRSDGKPGLVEGYRPALFMDIVCG